MDCVGKKPQIGPETDFSLCVTISNMDLDYIIENNKIINESLCGSVSNTRLIKLMQQLIKCYKYHNLSIEFLNKISFEDLKKTHFEFVTDMEKIYLNNNSKTDWSGNIYFIEEEITKPDLVNRNPYSKYGVKVDEHGNLYFMNERIEAYDKKYRRSCVPYLECNGIKYSEWKITIFHYKLIVIIGLNPEGWKRCSEDPHAMVYYP